MKYLNSEFINSIYLRLEYIFSAYLSFICDKLMGGNFKSRTKNRGDINFLKDRLTKNKKKRLAIFVAFHNPNLIPESNINHLNIFKKSFFETIYVHNGILSKKVVNELTDRGCYVICRKNIGQDFGAWKDCFALIDQYKLTNDLNWLLFCNDSNFCLGGTNSEKFTNKLRNTLDRENELDFISLNCNYERRLHYQSYFLCFSKIVFQNQRFRRFWKKYLPLNHRFHAIENGEKKLSRKVLNYFRPCVIYQSHKLAESISLNINNEDITLLGKLPKGLMYLEDLLNIEKDNLLSARIVILRIISSLENYNQSHVFGLLNIIYLNSPFLKKDVIRQGVFSYCQIYDLIKLNSLDINQNLQDEIVKFLERGGTSYSFIEDKRMAYRKGISLNGSNYEYQLQTQLLKAAAK